MYIAHCKLCGSNSISLKLEEAPGDKNVKIWKMRCGNCGCNAIAPENSKEYLIKLWNGEIKREKSKSSRPAHYSRWKIEPLDFIMANDLDFVRGNIIKYIMRYDAKGGLEDLKKARDYLDRLIEKVEREHK